MYYYSIKKLTLDELENILEDTVKINKNAKVFTTLNHLWIISNVDLEDYERFGVDVFWVDLVGSRRFSELSSKPHPERRYKSSWSSASEKLEKLRKVI